MGLGWEWGGGVKIKFDGIFFALLFIAVFLDIGLFADDSTANKFAIYGTAFATVILAMVTYKMVDEMRRSRIEQSRPSIFVDFDIPYGEQLIHIIVKNIGGAATNVKFKFDPALIDSRERNVSNATIFKNGINFFPPNKEIKQFFDSAIAYFGSGKPMIFNLSVSYSAFKTDNKSKESVKPEFEETFTLDLSTFQDLRYIKREGLNEISKSMDALVKEVSELKSCLKH